ncbi:hypothetical protein Mmah_1664 [Methanohalophilus mahii DSM 5219]|uniref:Nickel transport protein n=2 Tax=Methanohalophilus mahii TaxID=2176 RepID=D5E7M2_METMS|nr:hypothetical protein Mmah_1664 [Methanohalophilus mahii DSM 5219]
MKSVIKMNSRLHQIILFVLVLSLVLMPVASAHSVFMDVVEKSDSNIKVKAYYGGDDPMKNAEVTVYIIDESGETLYIEDASTDTDGFYSFSPEEDQDQYRVVASDFGHKAEKEIDLSSTSSIQSSSGTSSNLPLPVSIVAGFGYLAGIAGVAMMISARRMKKKYEEK